MKNIAIIGAGLSGLVLAHELKNHGDFNITFFEKSRGVGGRIATRYNEEWEFDHGVSFFETENESFLNFLQPFIDKKIIAKWSPKVINSQYKVIEGGRKYFIGTPKMNSLPKALAKNFDINFETKITSIKKKKNLFYLQDENDRSYEPFDIVITSTPPQQAYEILPNECLYKNSLKMYEMLPQFVCLIGFYEEISFNFDIMELQNSIIEKIVINHHKTDRSNKPSILVHSNYDWASKNIDTDKNLISEKLLKEFQFLTKLEAKPAMMQTHRWLYSKPKLASNVLFLQHDNLISCGDWLSSGTMEGAFLSGVSAGGVSFG